MCGSIRAVAPSTVLLRQGASFSTCHMSTMTLIFASAPAVQIPAMHSRSQPAPLLGTLAPPVPKFLRLTSSVSLAPRPTGHTPPIILALPDRLDVFLKHICQEQPHILEEHMVSWVHDPTSSTQNQSTADLGCLPASLSPLRCAPLVLVHGPIECLDLTIGIRTPGPRPGTYPVSRSYPFGRSDRDILE